MPYSAQPERPIRVAIVDDQAMVREGFGALLGAQPDIDVVGAAADGADATALVGSTRPDVVLMDIRMPRMNGLDATREVLGLDPGLRPRVIMLTTFDADEYVFAALRAGASGFLLKDVEAARLTEAVRHVAEGSMLLGPTITRRLVADFASRTRPAPTPSGWLATLTAREREIFELVARGLSNAECAERLWITEPTVKSHVSEVLRKSGCRDRVQLVIAAYEAGVVAVG